jgi:acyl-CoA synthetase (AMP-forming)/AMP-acid ligase II
MMQGYLPGIASPFTPIDIHPTGDIAAIDGDGNLRVVGRIRDIINLGGMKVDPADVETVLMEHPSVRDAAVYPGLRPNGAEFVQAAVVSAADPDTLRRHCLAELDAHKVPSVIHIVAKLPRTPSGKCLKVQCPGYPAELLAARTPAAP